MHKTVGDPDQESIWIISKAGWKKDDRSTPQSPLPPSGSTSSRLITPLSRSPLSLHPPSPTTHSHAGRALITRLTHIYTTVLSSPAPPPAAIDLAREALRRLIPRLKVTWDANGYLRAASALSKPPIKGGGATGSASASGNGITIGGGGGDVEMAEDSDHDDGGDHDMEAGASLPASSRLGVGAGAGSEGRGGLDMTWISAAKDAEKHELARLDTELKGYTSNLIKESIRVSRGA